LRKIVYVIYLNFKKNQVFILCLFAFKNLGYCKRKASIIFLMAIAKIICPLNDNIKKKVKC